MPTRNPYPTDVRDEEWAFVAPYLALVREDAAQRVYDLPEAAFSRSRRSRRVCVIPANLLGFVADLRLMSKAILRGPKAKMS